MSSRNIIIILKHVYIKYLINKTKLSVIIYKEGYVSLPILKTYISATTNCSL